SKPGWHSGDNVMTPLTPPSRAHRLVHSSACARISPRTSRPASGPAAAAPELADLRLVIAAHSTAERGAESAIGAIWDPCRTNRCPRPVTVTHAALLRPPTWPPDLGSRPWPGRGLSFGLIHPRTGPFTGGHSDRVRAARGRWRTPVNAMQHCWKACWGQPLASSNLASSAMLTCDDAHSLRPARPPGYPPWSQRMRIVAGQH